jgi:hypothetical protein
MGITFTKTKLMGGRKGVWVDYSELNAAVANTAAEGIFLTGHGVTVTARKFMKKVEQRTPVKTGRARAGWYKAVVGLGGKWTDKGTSQAQIALGKSEGSFKDRTTNKYKRYIAIDNNVPYIDKLEHGWSLQAPSGMVKLTALEMKGELRSKFIKGYTKAWRKGKLHRISRGKVSGKNPDYQAGSHPLG